MKPIKLKFLLLFSILTLLSCSSESEDPTPEPDTVSPTVDFSIAGSTANPNSSEPSVYSNQIVVEIDAEDAGGVAKVEAFLNNEKVGEDSSAPYRITVDLSNYSSKNASTGKFTDYTLKITVTDTSGNKSSVEETIHIDNELPTISEVTLDNNVLINGDTNIVSFSVSDNEGLSSVKTYLNNSVLEEITDELYEININTLELSDGENMFRIEAIDLANNIAVYEVTFVSDNTGPSVVLESLPLDRLVDESIMLSPEVSDEFSTVESVELLIGEESQVIFEGTGPYNWDFDPESFAPGATSVFIKSIDGLNNESVVEYPIDIFRRLITVNVPQGKLDNGMKMGIVFVSKMDGTLIDWKEMSTESQQIILRSSEEFDFETEFMLSFYLEENPASNAAYISTHQNLTRNNPEVLNLSAPKYFDSANENYSQLPVVNFISNDVIYGNGGNYPWGNTRFNTRSSAYNAALYFDEGYLSLGTSDLSIPTPFNEYYLYMKSSGIYRHITIDSPINEGYVLNKSSFNLDNVERGYFSVSNSSETYPSAYLEIFGATTLEDDGLNNYHQIYHANQNDFMDAQDFYYDLNTTFTTYKHVLAWENYYTQRRGTPLSSYDIPSWNLEYQVNGNTISLNADQNEPILGRVFCVDSDFEVHPTYNWTITFDSKKVTDVVIPQLPEFITHTISEAQNNNNILIKGAALYSYQDILDYNTYIDTVLKNDIDILDVNDWYQSFRKSYDGETWYGLNEDFPFNNY